MATSRWNGRVALVTGASGGIGAAICEELMKLGMTVLGVGPPSTRSDGLDIDELSTRINAEIKTGQFFAYKCDLSKKDDICKLHKQLRDEERKIQLCINSAVVIKNSSLVDGEPSDWEEMLNVNVLGLCINTSEAVKTMLDYIKKGDIEEGQVIQMGGIVGHKIPILDRKPPGTPEIDLHLYAGTKFMVRGLTEGLRREVKDRKIRVSTISPGTVQTKLLEKATSKKAAGAYFATYECLQPKDVADAVVYILSTPKYQNVHDIIMEPVQIQICSAGPSVAGPSSDFSSPTEMESDLESDSESSERSDSESSESSTSIDPDCHCNKSLPEDFKRVIKVVKNKKKEHDERYNYRYKNGPLIRRSSELPNHVNKDDFVFKKICLCKETPEEKTPHSCGLNEDFFARFVNFPRLTTRQPNRQASVNYRYRGPIHTNQKALISLKDVESFCTTFGIPFNKKNFTFVKRCICKN